MGNYFSTKKPNKISQLCGPVNQCWCSKESLLILEKYNEFGHSCHLKLSDEILYLIIKHLISKSKTKFKSFSMDVIMIILLYSREGVSSHILDEQIWIIENTNYSQQNSMTVTTLKGVLIGNAYVGKTSLVTRFVDNTFSDSFISTIGIDFKIRYVDINGKQMRIQLWDVAGKERFRTITTSYYRGKHIIYIVYDITEKESFESVPLWIDQIRLYDDPNMHTQIVVIGTKLDLDYKKIINNEVF